MQDRSDEWLRTVDLQRDDLPPSNDHGAPRIQTFGNGRMDLLLFLLLLSPLLMTKPEEICKNPRILMGWPMNGGKQGNQ